MDVETARKVWPDPVAAEAEYVRLMTLLYGMTDEECQSERADAIRDACEFPWYAMEWDRHALATEQAQEQAARQLEGSWQTSPVNYNGRPVPLVFKAPDT